MVRVIAPRTLIVCILAMCVAGIATAQGQRSMSPENPASKIWPPWNNPVGEGLNFTINQIDNVPDLHGDIVDP